jgi:hypothetical protein
MQTIGVAYWLGTPENTPVENRQPTQGPDKPSSPLGIRLAPRQKRSAVRIAFPDSEKRGTEAHRKPAVCEGCHVGHERLLLADGPPLSRVILIGAGPPGSQDGSLNR